MTGHAVADVVERLGVGLREVGQRHARLGPDDLGLVGVPVPAVSWAGVQATRASRVMTRIRCIVKWSLPLECVEQLATFGLAGLQAFAVLAGHEETGDEAAQ